MNISQLERIKKMIQSIRNELKTDAKDTVDLFRELECFNDTVNDVLKVKVWKRYLEAEN